VCCAREERQKAWNISSAGVLLHLNPAGRLRKKEISPAPLSRHISSAGAKFKLFKETKLNLLLQYAAAYQHDRAKLFPPLVCDNWRGVLVHLQYDISLATLKPQVIILCS